MDLLGSAMKISNLVFCEYEKLFSEYQKSGEMPSFEKLENMIYIENRFYSGLKDFQLEWIREKLISKNLAPMEASFFDFFYYLDNDDKLYSRICSRCGLEIKRRKQERADKDAQLAYFPLYFESRDYQDNMHQMYKIFDTLHLHQFLLLLEEDNYLQELAKMVTRIYIAYIYPSYEKYFLQNKGQKLENLEDVYQLQRQFLNSDEEFFFDVFQDCYDSVINYERTQLKSIDVLTNTDELAYFLYRAYYVKSFFMLRYGNELLENDSYFDAVDKDIELHYQKMLKRLG